MDPWHENIFETSWSMTCISKDERFADGRWVHLARRPFSSAYETEHRSVPRWEQMECEFLLRARRENEKWDNSSQLIHCTLKTHYFLRRKQKTCSPRWKEILCSRWRPWHSLPDFPHVCSFFYVRFSRFDSFLLTGSFVPAWQWYKD